MRPPTSASRHEEMAFESTFEDRCMPRRALSGASSPPASVDSPPPNCRWANSLRRPATASRAHSRGRADGASGRRRPPTAANERPPQPSNAESGMPVVPPGRSGEEERRFDGGDEQHEPEHRVLLPGASYLSWSRFSAPNGSDMSAVHARPVGVYQIDATDRNGVYSPTCGRPESGTSVGRVRLWKLPGFNGEGRPGERHSEHLDHLGR